jgi:hypothetical protein
MDELEERLRSLDRVETPIRWEEVRSREPRPASPASTRARRVSVAAFALALSFAVFAWAVVVLSSRSSRVVPPRPGQTGVAPVGRPITVTALTKQGDVRCTARFPSSVIQPGARTGVVVTVENLSRPKFSLDDGANDTVRLIERSPSGELLQDTQHMHDGIIGGWVPQPRRVPIGTSIRMPAYDAPVLWPGTIVVTPLCPIGGTVRLPAVRLHVYTPGRAPVADAAVARAVATAGAPFTTCTPTRDQVWVTGRVRAKSGVEFRARCGALVLQDRGFDTVVVAIVTPPTAPAIDLHPFVYVLGYGGPRVDVHGSFAVSWWTYVLTHDAVTKVRAYSLAQNCEGSELQLGGGVLTCRFPTNG